VTVLGLALAAAVLLLALPEQRQLVWLGLYTIPSHMLISPFPHEPALLHCAKTHPLWSVTLASTIGCSLAGMFDYWVLTPLFRNHKVRRRLEGMRIFQKSQRLFRRRPFLVLALTGMTPLPAQPFKFLSVAIGYPAWKYVAALVVGRTPKYYLLAWLGYMLQPPTWLLLLLTFGMLVPFLWEHLAGNSALATATELAPAGSVLHQGDPGLPQLSAAGID